MALYLNEKNNTLVFTEKDFDINRNYLPDFLMAMGKLNADKPINIGLDIRQCPVLFVLYFRKVLDSSNAEVAIFYRDRSEALRKSLKSYSMEWNPIKKFPFPLPNEEIFPSRENNNKDL